MHPVADITPLSIGLVTVGMVGALVYLLVEPVNKALKPLGELLTALRPLLIPFLVIATAATVNFSAAVQFVAAVALVLVGYCLIIRPELAKQTELKAFKSLSGGAVIAVGILVLILAARSVDSILSGQSGLAGACLVIALTALGLAAIARLASYSTHFLRVPVSLLLILAAWFGLSWAGIGVAYHADSGKLAAHLFLAALVALVIRVEAEPLLRLFNVTTEIDGGDTLAGVGLSLATVSGGLVVVPTASSLF